MAIFASGAGSNAKKIIGHFNHHPGITVSLIVCNKPGAGVLKIAADHNIPFLTIEKETFFRGNAYIDELRAYNINFIVLAGFLWKIPEKLIKAYQGNIINIHPALLPKYGGKGMYGSFVHEAVIRDKETQSGITIHFVDELYDHGDHILQVTCPVYPSDTPALLAQRIHALEHEYFPATVEKVVMEKKNAGAL
nr:phosphoribosylglycinamide formyltransferase [Panacibacter microcysteis]